MFKIAAVLLCLVVACYAQPTPEPIRPLIAATFSGKVNTAATLAAMFTLTQLLLSAPYTVHSMDEHY